MTYLPGMFPVEDIASGGESTLQAVIGNDAPTGKLIIEFKARTTLSAQQDDLYLRFNGDGSAIWNLAGIAKDSGFSFLQHSLDGTNQTGFNLRCTGDNADANFMAGGYVIVPNYRATNQFKVALAAYHYNENDAGGDLQLAGWTQGMWKSTDAVNEVSLVTVSGGETFIAGSFLRVRVLPG